MNISKEELRKFIEETRYKNQYKSINRVAIEKNNIIYQSLLEYTSFLNEYNVTSLERIEYFINDLSQIKKCPYCDNKIKYLNRFYETCGSKSCKVSATQTTTEKNHGYKTTFQCKEKHQEIVNKALSEQSKEKRRKTNLVLYGDESFISSKIGKEKTKNTNISKYGVEYSLSSDEVRNKIKQTNLIKYGKESYTKTEDFEIKRLQATNLKYDRDYHEQKHIPKETLELLKTPNFFIECINKKYSKIYVAKMLGVSINTIRRSIKKLNIDYPNFNISTGHQEIIDFCNQIYSKKIIINNRKIIYPYELDIYFPELHLAIEYNGIYYHSLNSNRKNFNLLYHQKKTLMCNDKGIDLIHFFEGCEENKIKNIIEARLKKIPLEMKLDRVVKNDLNHSISRFLIQNNYSPTLTEFPKQKQMNGYIYFDAGIQLWEKRE